VKSASHRDRLVDALNTGRLRKSCSRVERPGFCLGFRGDGGPSHAINLRPGYLPLGGLGRGHNSVSLPSSTGSVANVGDFRQRVGTGSRIIRFPSSGRSRWMVQACFSGGRGEIIFFCPPQERSPRASAHFPPPVARAATMDAYEPRMMSSKQPPSGRPLGALRILANQETRAAAGRGPGAFKLARHVTWSSRAFSGKNDTGEGSRHWISWPRVLMPSMSLEVSAGRRSGRRPCRVGWALVLESTPARGAPTVCTSSRSATGGHVRRHDFLPVVQQQQPARARTSRQS